MCSIDDVLLQFKKINNYIKAIFSTLSASHSYHAPLIENRGSGTRRGRRVLSYNDMLHTQLYSDWMCYEANQLQFKYGGQGRPASHASLVPA